MPGKFKMGINRYAFYKKLEIKWRNEKKTVQHCTFDILLIPNLNPFNFNNNLDEEQSLNCYNEKFIELVHGLKPLRGWEVILLSFSTLPLPHFRCVDEQKNSNQINQFICMNIIRLMLDQSTRKSSSSSVYQTQIHTLDRKTENHCDFIQYFFFVEINVDICDCTSAICVFYSTKDNFYL